MATTPTRIRPYDQQGGQPLRVDLACLPDEQRRLWDKFLPGTAQWTEGTICQATRLELWTFGYACMLDGLTPAWPRAVEEAVADYARLLREYMANVRAAGRSA